MTNEEKIICKMYLNDLDKTHSCNEYKLLMEMLEAQPTDAVSREAVLELAKKGILVSNDNYKCVVNAIKSLPTVIPQRKKGEWLWDLKRGLHQCSNCGEDCGFDYKYCPNCGALMEVEDADSN